MQRYGSWIIILTGIILLSGCGKGQPLKERSKGSAAFGCLSDNTLQADDTKNEELTELLPENVSDVIVGIRLGERSGSGVIFQIKEEEMVIVTAAHVISSCVSSSYVSSSYAIAVAEASAQTAEGEVLQVTLADGTVLEDGNAAWHISISEEFDLGFLMIPTDEIPSQAYAGCRYAVTDKTAFDGLSADDRILIMGSADETAANAYEGRLVEPWIYLEDYGQYMMLVQGDARPGMSGGGVFDSHGYFIGILSGANEQGILAVLPLSIIQSEYTELEE